MPKSNWSSTHEERERRPCRRGLRFSGGEGHWVLSGVVRRRAQSFRGRLCPHEWISIRQAQQIIPVKSLLPQITPTPLPFSSHSSAFRAALRLQSDSSPWALITVSSTSFHSLRIPLPWSYQHLVSLTA